MSDKLSFMVSSHKRFKRRRTFFQYLNQKNDLAISYSRALANKIQVKFKFNMSFDHFHGILNPSRPVPG